VAAEHRHRRTAAFSTRNRWRLLCHTFVTYDRRLVTIELFTGQLVLRDPKDIDHYHAL
jgi:hypothetical protein